MMYIILLDPGLPDVENNRILRVNMSNIRRKIEFDTMNPQYILTEIGVGYRMAER